MAELERIHENQTVTKSHELVAANIDDMTLKEAQLLALAVSMIPEDAESKPDDRIKVTIERRTLDMAFGLNGMSNTKLKQLATQLQTRAVTVRPRDLPENLDLFDDEAVSEELNKEWRRMVIVPTCEYKDGRFTLTLNQDLNEHFLELRERFTSYRLANIIGLSSPYHLRLYEILLMRAVDGSEIRIEPGRLRDMLGAQGKYAAFFEFRRRVLEPAVQAVSEHTDLIVDYETVKIATEIVEIIFRVSRKDDLFAMLPAPSRAGEDDRSQAVAILMEHGLPQTAAMKVADLHQGTLAELEQHVQAARHFLVKLERNGSNMNPAGVFYKAVKEKWIPQVQRAQAAQRSLDEMHDSAEKMDETTDEAIDYEKLCSMIEADRNIAEGFLTFLQQRRDMVSLMLFQQHGLRGQGLKRVVTEYGQGLIRKGMLQPSRGTVKNGDKP